MNLNSLSDKLVTAAATNASARAQERAAAPAPGSAPGSAATPTSSTEHGQQPSVELRLSAHLSAITQTMTHNVARSGADVFNAEKVQAMRSAIQNGSFSVNAEVISERLVTDAREMLGVAAASPRTEQTPSPSR